MLPLPLAQRLGLAHGTTLIVEQETSRKAAQALEDKVRRDVGRDNVRVQPPPAYDIPTKLPKWVEDLIDIWYP